MNAPLTLFSGVCSLGNHIFVMGGYDGTNQLNTVERYDVETDSWSFAASMRHRRSALGATALHGRIYVMGELHLNNLLTLFSNGDLRNIIEHCYLHLLHHTTCVAMAAVYRC